MCLGGWPKSCRRNVGLPPKPPLWPRPFLSRAECVSFKRSFISPLAPASHLLSQSSRSRPARRSEKQSSRGDHSHGHGQRFVSQRKLSLWVARLVGVGAKPGGIRLSGLNIGDYQFDNYRVGTYSFGGSIRRRNAIARLVEAAVRHVDRLRSDASDYDLVHMAVVASS